MRNTNRLVDLDKTSLLLVSRKGALVEIESVLVL